MEAREALNQFLDTNKGASFSIEATGSGIYVSISRTYIDEFGEQQEDHWGNYYDELDEGIWHCLKVIRNLESVRKRKRLRLEIIK